ncbi:MAG: site-2 protease family protein, partial [Candidatus Margulisiibacteriota bacterium]
MLSSMIYFAILFGLVVFFHELGHLLLAKKAGIGVSEFAIGLGPCLFRTTKGETVYKINLLPLGGMVKIAGIDDQGDCPTEKNFYQKSWLARFSVILAGPLMNFVLAFFLFFTVYSIIGIPYTPSNKVEKVFAGMPAEKAGLVPGDLIVGIDQTNISRDNASEIVALIK